MSKEDIKVETDRNLLKISAEKQSSVNAEEKNFTRKEYNYSSFERTFTMPENVNADEIKASCENGELIINLPKSEIEKTSSKKVKIS